MFVINKTRTIFRDFQSRVVLLVRQAAASCSVSKEVKVRVKDTLRPRVSQSVLVSSPSWGSWADFSLCIEYYRLSVLGRPL